MNSFNGNIKTIQVNGNLSLVLVEVTPKLQLKAIVIDTPETAAYLQSEASVAVLFKETEVIIGTAEVPQISLQNRIPASIVSVEKGALLTKLKLQSDAGGLIAIISTDSASRLELQEGKKVIAMIKLNEVMLRGL
ncbi:MAG: TOBE domain-containing protein [Bacteroidota bacterium]|nr:TOBE domain-containing protein [Bacteroidota bacterium]MEC8682301.1 TOBE domain-containing protein [Bacteroidota bacterium]MEE3224671.1 TOBE domain-containing protein [Bacteroidota bacterium]MEE3244604.1 TOBE domain-containing protein [Bacteroidota bacterium]